MDEVVALSSMLRAGQLSSTSKATNIDDIPNLIRSLPQVHSDSTKLLSARAASKNPDESSVTSSVHPAALRLFASVGFEVDRLRRAVSTVDTTTSFVDLPIRALDPHRYPTWLAPRALDNARLSMNSAIRDASKKAAIADLVNANERLLAQLSAKYDRQAPMDLSQTVGTPRTPGTVHTARRVRAKSESGDAISVAAVIDERYVEAIRSITLHGDAHSAPFLLHEVATSIPDSPHFVESLAIIASIARHSPQGTQPTEDMTVWGARVVLEDQFAESIPGLPQKPRLAAPAAVLPAIADYVRDLQTQGRLSDVSDSHSHVHETRSGQFLPLWPQVFFCMRIGNVRAALMVLREADHAMFPEAKAISQFCQRFLQGRDHARMKYLRSNPRSGDSDVEMGERNGGAWDDTAPMVAGYLVGERDYIALHNLYKEVAWPSKDSYLRACIVLLLRLELLSTYGTVSDMQGVITGTKFTQPSPSGKHQKCSPALPDPDMSQVFGSVEDYMWLRLWLCRTPTETEATAQLSGFSFVRLKEVQADILSCGSSHFDSDNSQPLLYSFVLVCCGLYDEAVHSLATHSDEQMMQPSAHLAIALYHLKWSKDIDAFHSVLMGFVSVFSRLFPVEAALYLLTIREKSVLMKLLTELVLSTGEYTTLLGTKKEGDIQQGALENLLTSATVPVPSGLTSDDIATVRIETALQGARDASERGEFAVAADLYELAGKRIERLKMIMKSLAEVVDKQSSSRRSLAVAQAKQALRSFEDEAVPPMVEEVFKSIRILLGVATVFEEYWTWRFGTAWTALRQVKLLPLTTAEISNCRRNLTGSGEKYDECIRWCAFEVLKVALHIAERALELGCVDKKAQNSSPPHSRNAIDGQIQMLDASEIKTLCIFAGLLRISEAEVNERLVRIELLLSS